MFINGKRFKLYLCKKWIFILFVKNDKNINIYCVIYDLKEVIVMIRDFLFFIVEFNVYYINFISRI